MAAGKRTSERLKRLDLLARNGLRLSVSLPALMKSRESKKLIALKAALKVVKNEDDLTLGGLLFMRLSNYYVCDIGSFAALLAHFCAYQTWASVLYGRKWSPMLAYGAFVWKQWQTALTSCVPD